MTNIFDWHLQPYFVGTKRWCDSQLTLCLWFRVFMLTLPAIRSCKFLKISSSGVHAVSQLKVYVVILLELDITLFSVWSSCNNTLIPTPSAKTRNETLFPKILYIRNAKSREKTYSNTLVSKYWVTNWWHLHCSLSFACNI